MEYTLHELNQKADLTELKLSQFIDNLNLIGTEVDDLIFERCQENKIVENIRIVLKIPANREDLMNEIYLLNDLSTFFSFPLLKKWNHSKKLYANYFNKIYKQSLSYKISPILSAFPEIKTYIFKTNLKNQGLSPKWIQKKLQNFGEEPRDLFSDLTQLVFLEWGQKFNFLQSNNLVSSNCFYLKQTNEEKTFITSSGKNIILPKNSFIIVDSSDSIINCFGYFESHFKESDNIIFQIWFYDIHQNQYEINSLESPFSLRIFRQCFYETLRPTIQRLFTLLEIISKKKLELQVFKSENKLNKIKTYHIISLNRSSAKSILNFSDYDINIFEKAGLKLICKTRKKLYFQVSNLRKDLAREVDLIEEYSRFIGYKNFETINPIKTNNQISTHNYRLRNYFLSNGFHEIQTSPLQDKFLKNKKAITILNPISKELERLRTELISSCLILLENNSRIRNEYTRFFEIGRTFQRKEKNLKEIEKIGGIFQLQLIKNKQQQNLEWFQAKTIIENFLNTFGYSDNEITFSFDNFNQFSFSHPTRSMRIKNKEKTIGIFGQINPQKEKKINSKFNTYFFEFDLSYFPEWKSKYDIRNYEDYSKYPAIIRDVSFVFPKKIIFSKLKTQILTVFPLIKRINVFDIYFDEEKLETIRLGLRFEFQSTEKTLINEEIENYLPKIDDFLSKNFEADKCI